MIDLSPVHLAIVEGILAEHVPECEVRAFGSRATWNAKDYSDLDLAVVGEGPLPRGALARLKEAFEESRLPMRVDVVDWNAIADGFREAIESDCVLVQEGTLPRVKDEWREMSLGEAVELKRGYDLPKRDRSPGPVPLVSSSGITDHHGEAKVKGPGVVTGRYGTLGQVFFVRDDFWPLNTTLYVRDFKGNDPRFISYFLRTLDFSAYSDKAAVPSLNRNHLHQEIVRVPPVEEQRAIARVLGALDDKIELNRRMSETLEEMARALFRSWFVDFDPVRAKAEGRPSGLPPDLDALFPASFEASELGEIPAGWEVRSLDEIATFTNGLALQRFPPEGDEWLPVIKIAEMKRGYTEKSGRASADIDPRYIVEDGDLLFSWSGSLELVFWTHGRGALNQHLFKVTSDEFPRWFYWGWTCEHLDDFRGIAAGKATTMGHIQRHHLTDAKVVAPPPDLVAASDTHLATLVQRQVGFAVQSRALGRQRDVLLPRLVSGVVRVGHLDTVGA